MLILERPWTRQPQTVVGVDYSHPSAKGLVFAWNGATRRNATKQPGLHSSYGSGLTDHYANNTGFNPNGTGSLSFTGTHTCTSNEITVLYVFRYLTTAQFTQWKVQYGIPYGSVLSVGVYLSGANILSDAAAINLGDNLSLNSLFVVYPGSGSTSAFHLNNNNDVVVTSSATLTGLTPTIRLCANSRRSTSRV